MIDIAIVGGGPAGAYCAYSLARKGFKPLIFDHSHPREKPCGGGLTPLAQEMYPFLRKLPFVHGEANQIQIVYMSRKKISIPIKRKYIFTSRLKLDEYILDMAVSNGARLEREKVTDIKRCREGWEVRTNKRLYKVKTLIGADGVYSLVRRVTVGLFHAADLGICYGYLAKPLKEQHVKLKFLPERKGYLWLFPRGDHLCIGIAADPNSSLGLKTELDSFLKTHCPHLRLISRWAALIPTLRSQTFQKRTAGCDWMLIGDAAGHVDPVSGEGIPYALRSAELASEAISQSSPESYDSLWREEYGEFLSRSSRLRGFIFNRGICTPYFIFASMVSG